MTSLHLQCADPYLIGLFGTLLYASEVLFNMILPPLSDRHGRRLFIYFGATVCLLVLLLLLVSSSLNLSLALVTLFGAAVSTRMFVTYPHLMETIPPSLSAGVSNWLFFTDGLVYVVSPVILLIGKDTQWLLTVGISFNVLCMAGLF